MTITIREDGYVELRPNKDKIIINIRTGIKHTIAVCKPENKGNYIEVNPSDVVDPTLEPMVSPSDSELDNKSVIEEVEPENQNDENSETEEPTEE